MPDLSNTPMPYLELSEEGSLRVVQPPAIEKSEDELHEERLIRFPQTEKLRTKLEAEMAAGKAAIELAAERRRLNPPRPPSAKDVAAQGTTTPVFRPGDFVEYAKEFRNQAQARGKGE